MAGGLQGIFGGFFFFWVRAASPRNNCEKNQTGHEALTGCRGNVSLGHPDRRKIARLPLEVFLRLRISGGHDVEFAETRDVSARGLYFLTRAHVAPGQELECILV